MPGEVGAEEYPYPLPSEVPDGPGGFLALAEAIRDVTEPVATQAALLLLTDNWPGRTKTVTAIPGATFHWNGAAWKMQGIPEFTNSTARTAAITSPADGMKSRLASDGFEYEYNGSAWVKADTLDMAIGVGRGTLAPYLVTNLAGLDALSNAVVGDTAYMTTPGTGINPLTWVAFAGSGSGIDWRPDEEIIASTKTNLDNFISAVAAISDTVFEVGGTAYVTGTKCRYRFTSTSGTMILDGGVRHTINTTAADRTVLKQSGISKATGTNAANLRPVVVFDIPFSDVPVCFAQLIGFRATGAFNLSGLGLVSGEFAQAGAPTASQFTVNMSAPGSTFSSSTDFYYVWSAEGPI